MFNVHFSFFIFHFPFSISLPTRSVCEIKTECIDRHRGMSLFFVLPLFLPKFCIAYFRRVSLFVVVDFFENHGTRGPENIGVIIVWYMVR